MTPARLSGSMTPKRVTMGSMSTPYPSEYMTVGKYSILGRGTSPSFKRNNGLGRAVSYSYLNYSTVSK